MSAIATGFTQLANEKYPIEVVAAALQKSRGMVTIAAKVLGCVPKTVYNYLDRYPELQEVKRNQREAVTDTAELKLLSAIERCEPWAVSLYLKTQGKDRGYVERIEQTGRDGAPIQIDLTEIKREKLTVAVQNGLNSGWSLRDTLEYLTLRGVSREDLAMVRGEDLLIPATIDITDNNGAGAGSAGSNGGNGGQSAAEDQ